jgi:hypothetical protein
MKKNRRMLLLIILVVSLSLPLSVSAQTYRFSISQYEVEAYLNKDGTLDLRYFMVFENSATADVIDFIDIGLPVSSFSTSNVEATVNDQKITDISNSPYVQGIALGLGDNAIPSGQSGTLIVWITRLSGVLFPYDQADRENYVNFQFSPNTFDSEFDKSNKTKYRMTIILPPDVGVDAGVYYTPNPWPGDGTPEASTTKDGRVYYSWYTETADTHSYYQFGSAFPASAVPAESISSKEEYVAQATDTGTSSGGSGFLGSIFSSGNFCCLGFGGLFAAFMAWVIYQSTVGVKKRKLAYLPPKIAIEGMGVKRGLTAVEAAILQEQPLDKVMTMILFGVLKKNAATVLQREPLKLQVVDPLPEGLQDYETGFLVGFKEQTADRRRVALQTMMVDLVKTTTAKMKGFSRKETNDYYKDISERAWQMVETAQTPEVKSESYDKSLEWTMLDKDFGGRTQRTFTGGPVFLPVWWGRYDPVYRQSTAGAPRPMGAPSTASIPGVGGSRPSMSLPNIPGSNFAASMVNGMTGMAAGVIGSVSDFTSGITNRTNPIPVTSTSSGSGGFRGGGGGGRACACACACAGCACACAGGGR